MNKLIKIFSFTLVLCLLLTGCASESKNDSAAAEDYAVVQFDVNHWQVTNAEGKQLYWRKDLPGNADLGQDSLSLEGDMEYWDEYMLGMTLDQYFTTPFSDSFTVQTRLPMEGTAGFGVAFYRNGECVQDLYVGGSFEGTATIFADGVIELRGNNHDFAAEITLQNEKFRVEGSGERKVKIYMKNGELAAEGMVGEYVVKKSSSETDDTQGKEISSETRQGSKTDISNNCTVQK